MASVFQQLGSADDDRKRKSSKKRRARKAAQTLPSWTGPASWALVDEEQPWDEDFDFELTEAEAKVSKRAYSW